MNNDEQKRTFKDVVKNLWRNHKGKILIAGGIVAIGVTYLLTNKPETKEEIVEETTKKETEQSYKLYWLQSTNPDNSWTLDLPVDNSSTLEAEIQKVKDDLNNGNYEEVEM